MVNLNNLLAVLVGLVVVIGNTVDIIDVIVLGVVVPVCPRSLLRGTRPGIECAPESLSSVLRVAIALCIFNVSALRCRNGDVTLLFAKSCRETNPTCSERSSHTRRTRLKSS
jgi:hypothetical protein